jgi:hypothetical protein
MGPLGKRKQGAFIDDEIMAFNHMTRAIKDVTHAIRDNKPTDVHLAIYEAVIEVDGFTEDVLLAALGHLIDHKDQATLFVGMVAVHGILRAMVVLQDRVLLICV